MPDPFPSQRVGSGTETMDIVVTTYCRCTFAIPQFCMLTKNQRKYVKLQYVIDIPACTCNRYVPLCLDVERLTSKL